MLISPPINCNKKKQSDHVDKMPISGSRLKTKMVGCGKMIKIKPN